MNNLTDPTRRRSARFRPGLLSRYVVPALLALLALGLLATLVLIGLSLLGLTPGA